MSTSARCRRISPLRNGKKTASARHFFTFNAKTKYLWRFGKPALQQIAQRHCGPEAEFAVERGSNRVLLRCGSHVPAQSMAAAVDECKRHVTGTVQNIKIPFPKYIMEEARVRIEELMQTAKADRVHVHQSFSEGEVHVVFSRTEPSAAETAKQHASALKQAAKRETQNGSAPSAFTTAIPVSSASSVTRHLIDATQGATAASHDNGSFDDSGSSHINATTTSNVDDTIDVVEGYGKADSTASQCQAQAQQGRQTCCVCFCDEIAAEGIMCGDKKHFMCFECFDHYVHSVATGDDRLARGSALRCPDPNCTSDPFKMQAVAKHIQVETFNALERLKEDLTRQRVKAEMEQEHAEAQKRRANMSQQEQEVQEALNHIIADILTLKCPRCNQAFVDYDGCAALSCNNCECNFCGLCLSDCGCEDEAHRCVMRCSERLGHSRLFVAEEVFAMHHHDRRQRLLDEFLAGLAADIRPLVTELCVPHVADHGLIITATPGEEAAASSVQQGQGTALHSNTTSGDQGHGDAGADEAAVNDPAEDVEGEEEAAVADDDDDDRVHDEEGGGRAAEDDQGNANEVGDAFAHNTAHGNNPAGDHALPEGEEDVPLQLAIAMSFQRGVEERVFG